MKKLSIEEKAKAYDEAIYRVKHSLTVIGVSPDDEPIDVAKRMSEYIFPELAESENEKIKSDIQYAVLCAYGDKSERTNKILGWLEKQSKASNVEEAMREVVEKAKAFTEAHKSETSEEILAQMKGEQKPIIVPKFRVGDEIEPKNKRERSLTITKVTDLEYYSEDLLICRISEQDEWELVEQKSVEHNDNVIIDPELNDYCCKIYSALYKEKGGVLSFACFQHLAMDIQKWCKKQQKSVECDESIIDETISLINKLASGYGEKVDEPITFNGVKVINNIKERLRAIKPQPQKEQWKPSEKQIEAVRIAAEIGTANDSWAMGILKSMYRELKHMMEE